MHPWIVDVFAEEDYLGNPAAVVSLDGAFAPSDRMQEAARKLDLPTTAFIVRRGDLEYDIRWFTPCEELLICGHATIASAAYHYHVVGSADSPITFRSRKDLLRTVKNGAFISIDLPRVDLTPCRLPDGVKLALSAPSVACGRTENMLVVELPSEADVARLRPDLRRLATFPFRGYVVTAAGTTPSIDFVSRSFFPAIGVDEDQVCVSAHRFLGPYWAGRVGRPSLSALQLSERGGHLRVETGPDRVVVAGTARVRAAVGGATSSRPRPG